MRKASPALASAIWSANTSRRFRRRLVWRKLAAGAARRRRGAFATDPDHGESGPPARGLVATDPPATVRGPCAECDRALVSGAVGRLASWDPPMRLNDTTRTYFEKLGLVSEAGGCTAFQGSVRSREYRRRRGSTWPSMSRDLTRCCILRFRPTSFRADSRQRDSIRSNGDAGYPGAAGRKMPAFYELMRKVINDPAGGNCSRMARAAPARCADQHYVRCL